MGIFTGKRGLRHQFEKLVSADLLTAITKPTAKLWVKYGNYGRLSFFDNTLVTAGGDPIDVNLVLVHPDADAADNVFRLEWLELPGLRVINFGTGDAPGISFDPKTRIYVYNQTGLIPAAGALRASVWG